MCLSMCFVQCGEDKKLSGPYHEYPQLRGRKLFGGRLDGDNLENLSRVRQFFGSDCTFIGYKFLKYTSPSISNEGLYSLYNDTIKLNTWMTAQKNLERTKDKEVYVTGFHILWNREEARKWKDKRKYVGSLYKVEYKFPHALGLDRDCQVVLASKMRIIGRV